jgi:hypothetical protein
VRVLTQTGGLIQDINVLQNHYVLFALWPPNAWRKVNRDAYTRLLIRSLSSGDVELRLPPNQVPIWLRPGRLGRDRDRALLAGLHLDERFLEAGNHLAGAHGELERLAAPRAVEHGPVVEAAGVMDSEHVAGAWIGHGILLKVECARAKGQRNHLAGAAQSGDEPARL